MRGIYLAAYKGRHPNYDIVYNDIVDLPGIDLVCDMLTVDLTDYDFIIASPPFNYYSKANYRRYTSEYSQRTKHLLPDILFKLSKLDKPFIVENVRNKSAFKFLGLLDLPGVYVIEYGRHTYFTNVNFSCVGIPQSFDFSDRGKRLTSNCQGGDNVYLVIERWLNQVVNGVYVNYQTCIFDYMR